MERLVTLQRTAEQGAGAGEGAGAVGMIEVTGVEAMTGEDLTETAIAAMEAVAEVAADTTGHAGTQQQQQLRLRMLRACMYIVMCLCLLYSCVVA